MPKFNLSNDETYLVIECISMALQGLVQHQVCECGLEDCASLLSEEDLEAHAAYGNDLWKLRSRFESRYK